MIEALTALLCCGGLVVIGLLLVAALGLGVSQDRQVRAPTAVEALAAEHGWTKHGYRVWSGTLDGGPFALQSNPGQSLGNRGGNVGHEPRLDVVVPVDRAPIGGDCYTKRPWNGEADFDKAFLCLPPQRNALNQATRDALMDLVVKHKCRAELRDAERATVVKRGLPGAELAVGLNIAAHGLELDRLREVVADLRHVAAIMEGRAPAPDTPSDA